MAATTPRSYGRSGCRGRSTVVGVLVGAAPAVAGTVLQGITRNPTAEPGILGISQGASLGVVVAIAFLGVHTLTGYL